ncbi:MAG: DUF1631 domain-containing protein [Sedimenticola thiotaurini]|uniref:DUF1631 domain-containing protein n=1 Tax=Sedimenticola thiotaurini TaxID=1543721 RepID=A0A558CUG7_9GAMM|nr:MAG: DUF1631 domain-containing protein [Sedimenticola thiotaurini]
MEELSNKTVATQPLKKHATLLSECKDMVMVYLTTQLNELYEQVEPALLDFAKKAETNASQVKFFDSINHILSLRDVIEHEFRESIEKGFDEFSQGKHITYPNTPMGENDEIELEMVDNDALEEHLAIQSMISKVQNNCYQELFALGKRMAVLRGGKKLAEDDIPACPAHTATAFQKAAEALDVDKQILLIFYFLFGKFVLSDAGTIYKSLNDKLIEGGIFPNLKLSSIIPPSKAENPAQSEEAFDEQEQHSSFEERNHPAQQTHGQPNRGMPNREGMALGEELFHSIHDLLTARRAADPNYRNHPEFSPGGNVAQLKSAPAIVQAISQIQPLGQADYLPDPNSEDGIPQSIELDTNLIQNVRRTLESERAKLLSELDKNTVPAADLDTIELVGMLFEQVLNEEGLANIAKALISHLHTPYLKVAILDRQFLTDEEHIARRLLNLMIDSGKRWIDEEDLRRGIYYPTQEIVKAILAEFKNELSIFDEMFHKLNTQVNELENRAKILEERNQEAAKGRERLETARKQVIDIIKERSKGRSLHPVLDRFLYHAWQDRMILMLLRDPDVEKSKEWTSALAVIDSLVRVMEAKRNPKVKQWLINNHQNLTQHIKAGLTSLGNYHHPDSHALFKLLDNALKDPQNEIQESVQKKVPVEVSEPIIKPLPSEDNGDKKTPPAVSEQEMDMQQTLRKIKFGTWFELTDDNNKIRRLKLSWFSPITHKYMFVDRFGIQAYITPSEELAKQLCEGKASIIKTNGIPFVSKALKTIHNILQKTVGMHPTT